MGIQVIGYSGSVAEVDGTSFRAQRVTPRPLDYGSLGHYKASVITGSMAAGLAANSEILQVRWGDATRLAVLTRLTLDGMIATTAFAAGQILLQAFIARSFSAPGTGGNTVALASNAQKRRTSMATSLLNTSGEIRSASTAALGVGTKTLDAAPVGQLNVHSAQFGIATPVIGYVGPSTGPNVDLIDPDVGSGEHPIVLAQNEGLVVRATVPGTGVWILGMTLVWAEVAAY
jgi:hypothetical protein